MSPPPSEVGVGPWPGPWPGDETGPPNHLDAELLAHGDRRNVVDHYRYWTREAIVEDLDSHRHEVHIAVENWGHDFNIGSVIRTANAFNVAAFHIVGRRRWNRRGAMVTDRYQHEHHHADIAELVAWADDIPLIALENTAHAAPLETASLPRRCVMLFGQEGPGLSEEALAAAQQTLAISQFGSTRSINAGAAAAIAMHAWVRQHVFGQTL
ncbi:MAG TPA: TrmH family RNA methyltransferase [Ornithinimicrobium sp.]|uniref:TrmH family RNA methyltransferase n=1 Tax=Ornithinimicrobium sp. TaxID=1977084 RepID=UPI002B4A71D3|nr:TrmH family RNA methyltransferase [Ornithinimicrobium sp.]HKJ13032.1 TrmH family RNA methyltransferase [Ornithinimicrobium sp.]